MATAPDLEIFSTAPPAPPARPRVLLIGSALASGSAAMVVLTLVAQYARLRNDVISGGNTWLPEEARAPLTPGNMGIVTLVMSMVTVAWIVYALRRRSHPRPAGLRGHAAAGRRLHQRDGLRLAAVGAR